VWRVKYFAGHDGGAQDGGGSQKSVSIERGDVLDILEHTNPARYAGQHPSSSGRDHYRVSRPFIEDEHTVFLKTIVPSRGKEDARAVRYDEPIACTY
jgi:hypothetical protein